VLKLLFAMFGLLSAGAEASRRPPIGNPALLNIGFVCRWQSACMNRQQKAMNRSLKYVRKYRPPAWKVQLCNRNASRKSTRVDWIGFDNCIRNPNLRRPVRSRRR
jgi:hypothetical protein